MTAALLRFEFAAARRGRTLTLFTVGFALASLAVALVGLSAGGVVSIQGFARTSVSLLQLVLGVGPLLALLVGAVAGAEALDYELVARGTAWPIALGAELCVGLGAAGAAIGVLAGSADAWRYLSLIGVSLLLMASCLALGLWLGAGARTRARAVALAVVLWFVLVIGVDLIAIAALAILPPAPAGWGLSLLLLADPVDSARALGLGLFRAEALAGPTGAALRQVMGGWGAWGLVAGLAAWTAVPLLLASRRFVRQDL